MFIILYHSNPIPSLIINHVNPLKQKIAFLLDRLDGLRCRYDRHPFLDILLGGVALFAEQVEVLICFLVLAFKSEQKVCPRCIRGGVALGHMCPVNDICLVILGNYDI